MLARFWKCARMLNSDCLASMVSPSIQSPRVSRPAASFTLAARTALQSINSGAEAGFPGQNMRSERDMVSDAPDPRRTAWMQASAFFRARLPARVERHDFGHTRTARGCLSGSRLPSRMLRLSAVPTARLAIHLNWSSALLFCSTSRLAWPHSLHSASGAAGLYQAPSSYWTAPRPPHGARHVWRGPATFRRAKGRPRRRERVARPPNPRRSALTVGWAPCPGEVTGSV